ncbi:tetratricopeptide repeat protein 27-like isoform X1 [Artemia franciscana]|uniref:Tetratricopeptide repeat protein 27 n=1 Tax=Artemia franciscana TaxID=6661 RepID=A0AA88KXA8_ARTSF|nr:hypothetical protein QYM36_015382 [Artemia franciscana]
MDSFKDLKEEEVIRQVRSLLLLFVRKNYFEPSKDEIVEPSVVTLLTLDGERLYPSAADLKTLKIVYEVLAENSCNLQNCIEKAVLTLQYVRVHQQMLDEKSVILHNLAVTNIDFLMKNIESLEQNEKVEVLLLIGYIHKIYFEYVKEKACFERAEAECGLLSSFTGQLGKRTYFQQSDITQMTMCISKLKHHKSTPKSEYVSDCRLPVNVMLNDDTRMEKKKLLDEKHGELPRLNPLDQAVLLGLYAKLEHLHFKDDILHEELLTVLDVVLDQPQNFCVQLCALMLRSNVERHKTRTVERSMMQLEELVKCVSASDKVDKTPLFFCTPVPPRWELERQLANLLAELGCLSSALEIYQRLEMWEDVVNCYKGLELRHKGEEVVRQQIAKGETPHLWCLLGECTDDVSCFEKAWELSGQRSSRAQRNWGMLLYSQKKFEEAVVHFKLSLEVNSLQAPVWLRLAYITLELESWEESAAAYRHYCLIDSDNFEAWNNLAKCYVKLGQKARACKAFQEATRLNYENWKVWDNYMAVTTDLGAFDEVIFAYNRVLDLRGKHVDIEILKVLVQAIDENLEDNSGNPSIKYKSQALKLFGHLTAQVPSNGQLWLLYCKLVLAGSDKNLDDLEKAAQLIQKSNRYSIQQINWERDSKTLKEVLEIAIILGKVHLDWAECLDIKARISQILGTAKLALKSTDSKLEQYKTSLITPLPNEIEELHLKLKEILSAIVTKSTAT